MAFEIRDQGLQGDIDFKVAFSKADILRHSYKVQNINFIVTELVQQKHVDVTNTKIDYLQNDMFSMGCLVIPKFSLVCTLRMRGI